MAELTVPLVALSGGLWSSPNPAWKHLIERESSGRPHVIQEIRDVNSGGNEAEGLFQITPKTWDRHGGRDFAPSARHATPQQQAIVAARIIQRNPSGSDWGAGRPGRENPKDLMAGLVPVGAAPAPATPPPAELYGLPRGSNSGGYGGNGVRFPAWVYNLGNAFGLKPSTYPGHQESNRNEAGFAPNPANLNRGIDWAAPGAPDEVDRMQRFADYLFSKRGELEQIIWENPRTGRRIGVAGGKDVSATPYYAYDGGYNKHRNHVHTRHSHSMLPPGDTPAQPPKPAVPKPAFTEIEMFGKGGSKRSRPPINFFIHTQEGPPGREISNASAKDLALYCQGQNGVSYHYTIRDGIVYDVVDTDLYSWSVLSANVFSINLCFAGSSVLLTRQQWLEKYGRDIDIAAYLAVQDCRKYGFSTEVLVPDWARSGGEVYAGGPRPGISDHNYVTRELGIGDHHDVGRNFPWDVFAAAVKKYANNDAGPGPDWEEDDMFTDADRAKLDKLLAEYNPDRRAPSRSFFAMDQIWGETPLGFEWNIDGNVNELYMTVGYLLGVKSIERDVEFIAANGVAPASWAGSAKDAAGKHWLAEVGQQWCQGLVAFRVRLLAKLRETDVQSVQNMNTATPTVIDDGRLTAALADLAAAQERSRVLEADLYAARAETQKQRDALASTPSASVELVQTLDAAPADTGQQIAELYRAVEQLDLSSALDIKDRATLQATIKILETKNGSTLS